MRYLAIGVCLGLVCCVIFAGGCVRREAAPAEVVTVDIHPAHRIAVFHPLEAIGSSVDKEPAGSIPSLYSKRNISTMLGAGLGWLSYRLYTELSDQDWHWNPAGTFSAGNKGYWTSSSSTASDLISDSFGYRLPHRGNTTDQGNNEDYSRLVDGDATTYWKSNPYLSSAFTGEPDSEHPQWAVIDLGAGQPVDAIRIDWVDPFALRYAIQYWSGNDAIMEPDGGRWITFPFGSVDHGAGGTVRLRLAPASIRARFVRVVMMQSSNTCDSHGSADRRNCVGYAISELELGRLDARGALQDLIHHAPCGGEKPGAHACGVRQTATYVSSVDPWHADADRVRNQEQPGLDLIATSGLTRSMPAMYPVPMLYSTPENAVAEIRYLEARKYPISFVELGEEPDGQYVEPEDYGALYLQWARALHAADPSLKLGGPVFSGVNSDILWWPNTRGEKSWLKRFVHYLKAHDGMRELAFMSFEHYPFEGCEHGTVLQRDLLKEPALVKGIVKTWRADGIPAPLPMYVTEAGFSSVNAAQASMQIEGGLWLADYLGGMLSNGVAGAVYYQYEPVPLLHNDACPSDWGNLSMFVADEKATIRARAAQFFAAQMIALQWLAPGNGAHRLFPATTNVASADGLLVTAYAVNRPDGLWSIMLVNKDDKPHAMTAVFADSAGHRLTFTGDVTSVQFGGAQYHWQPTGPASLPHPNDPPLVQHVSGGANATYALPAQSITVLRGKLNGAVP